MTHDKIFIKWLELTLIPVKEYFPNGKNAVRLVFSNGQELIFTYLSDDEWSVETKKRFVKRVMEKWRNNICQH